MGRERFHLKDIEIFLRQMKYPEDLKTWGEKSKFKRACKNCSINDGEFVSKEKVVVVLEKQRQLEIIKDVHQGIGESSHSTAMSSHYGRDSSYSEIGARFFWYRMYDDVADFIRSCELFVKNKET